MRVVLLNLQMVGLEKMSDRAIGPSDLHLEMAMEYVLQKNAELYQRLR